MKHISEVLRQIKDKDFDDELRFPEVYVIYSREAVDAFQMERMGL